MGKRARKLTRDLDFDPFDDFDDFYDDDFDKKEFARDIHSVEWGDDHDSDKKISARRKIERRRDMKHLYSQLDEWEQFGEYAEF